MQTTTDLCKSFSFNTTIHNNKISASQKPTVVVLAIKSQAKMTNTGSSRFKLCQAFLWTEKEN